MVEFVRQSTAMRITHTPEAHMRGDDRQQAAMWSYGSLEQRVLHPLRPMRAMVDTVLAELSPQVRPTVLGIGRPSIASVRSRPARIRSARTRGARMRRRASTIEERGFDKVGGRQRCAVGPRRGKRRLGGRMWRRPTGPKVRT